MTMNFRAAGVFAVAVAWTCLGTAQISQTHASSTHSAPDPLKEATKPLTPKSAAPTHHASAAVPPPAATTTKTSAELNKLERQNTAPKGPKTSNATAPKGPSTLKSADTSANVGSGVNFKYQKPAGGVEASTPNAHSPNVGTRVTKKN